MMGFLVVAVPEVWWNMVHLLTGLAVVSFGLLASVWPEKNLQTGNVLWYFSGLGCIQTQRP